MQLWHVTGIPGRTFPDKLTAETEARRAFPDEDPYKRYARVFYREVEDWAPRAFDLCVNAANCLPTVLSALALRVPKFTVIDEREGDAQGWLLRIPPLPQEKVVALLDAVPTHMAHVWRIAEPKPTEE